MSAAMPAVPAMAPMEPPRLARPRALVPEELRDDPLPREQVENFLFEIMEQPAWRREADKCADYYDGHQLSQDIVDKLQERGQPPLITNLIKPTIDTVLGMEAKARSDWLVRSEDDGQAEDDLAEAMSVKLKHAEIESRADRAVSDAYAAQVKAGLGWIEVAREQDPFKGRYRVKYIHRREIFWDWRAEDPGLDDARYLIRRRWLELDHAVAKFPKHAALLRNTVSAWSGFDPLVEGGTGLVQSWDIERDTRLSTTDWRDTVRKRVCISEIWYRKWVAGYILRLPNGRVIEADFDNPRHNEAILAGIAQVERATFQRVRLAWYVGPHFLEDIPSPYKHKHFPYVPFFGHREDQTNAPYGLIRTMLSPQDEVNARKSKMLWLLNSRRAIVDSDAVKDHKLAMQELARADAYIQLNAQRNPNSKFVVESGGEMARQQFDVMQEAKQEIAEASGIHKSMQGQQSGATSGLAINSLIEQGLNTIAELNDNYRYARRVVGEMLFELLQDDLSGKPSIVTIGEGQQRRVIPLNQPAVDEQTGRPIVLNNVAKLRPKIVIDEMPSTPTYRLQMMQMLSEVTKSLPPEQQALVADFMVEASGIPGRHKVADRLRSAMGIQSEQQQQAAAEQQQQAIAEQQDMARKQWVLEAALTAADIRKKNAEADKLQREALLPLDPPGEPINEPTIA